MTPTVVKETIEVAVLVGSLRKDALSRRAADAIVHCAPSHLRMTYLGLGDLPLYNPDLETSEPPSEWLGLREGIGRADAVLFVTPEYNRSLPAALKNAIDIGSRPAGHSVWAGKPAAIVTISRGPLGGFGANHHLRQPLVYLDMPVMPQPEAYLGFGEKLFDSDGRLSDETARLLFNKISNGIADWFGNFCPSRSS